jgi:hypothetical protein
MKPALALLTIICLVAPAAGQPSAPVVEVDPIAKDPTIMRLTALLEAKKRAAYGKSLVARGKFAALADKELLLRVRAEANRPNYGGNAAGKTHNNLWRAILEGKVDAPPPSRADD